ncbi:MAG: outer membrane protein assembly factor BamB [Kiritimatiellia bacterium]|jgi:outer membrane protein assembly factor BamB
MKFLMPILSVLISIALNTHADDWSNWRGPTQNGVAAAGDYPTAFGPDQLLKWKAALPGRGSSTPVIWGDNVFITCGIGKGPEGKDGVLCFDRNGKQRWQVAFGNQKPGKHKNGSGSNPSVVTDGTLLFAYYKSGTIAALDFAGKIKWQKNLQTEYGEDSLWWDLGTSPVLAGDNVVVAVMHEGHSYVVALKQEDGSVAWKVDRNFPCEKETHQSYTTPTVLGDELIIWGADHVTAHKISDGSTIWTSGGLNPENKAYWRMIASQSISDGVCVVPYGRAGYLAGIKIGGTGDVTKSNRLWTKEGIGSDVPTPVAADGKVIHLSDSGLVTLLDIQTGNPLGEFEIPKGRGKFYSSPTLAGGHLYCAREEGEVYVLKISGNMIELVSQSRFEDRFAAEPVLVDGHLYLRGVHNLYCFGN